MEASHCRISRVRMKGGADITVLKRPAVTENGAKMIEHARHLAATFGDSLCGFFILAFDADGSYSNGLRLPNECVIPLTLFPAWIEEIVRRELVTTQQVHDVLERDYVVNPPRPPS